MSTSVQTPTIIPPPSSAVVAPQGSSRSPLLPWLLAAFILGAAWLIYLSREQLGIVTRPAAVVGEDFFRAHEADAELDVPSTPPTRPRQPVGEMAIPRPQPFQAPESPAPTLQRAPAAATPGIVSARLRPWLEIAFQPSRAVVDEATASVQFDVVVTNSGSAPARQVLVEACMINAGAEQDIELRRFFDTPVGAGERIESIPPLGSLSLKSAVSLPLDQVRAYEVGGRKLFVPVVAFNALYEWSNGQGQSSASFILGRGANGGESESDGGSRMAPLRLDLGPRLFRDLDARRHPLGMRV
ncbi:MAG: hypothetical protein ABR588_04085 [Sphingomicrobium sp.]|nr:hypothetical protein [Sphingomonadales bacterium]